MEQTPGGNEILGRGLNMEDPRASGHPLSITVGDLSAASRRIAVLERPVDHVSHRLKSSVWMPCRSLRLAWCVFDLTHLIHVDKRINVAFRDAGEGAPH